MQNLQVVLFFRHHLYVTEKLQKDLLEETNAKPTLENVVLKPIANNLQLIKEMKSPRRVIKTHFGFDLLPPDLLNCGAKVCN